LNPRILIALIAPLVAGAATTESILARMDSAAASFRGMTANIKKITYTAIIKESTEEIGRIALLSPKQKAVNALIEIDKPDAKSYAFHDKKGQIYLPKINTVQEYDLGKYDSLLTQGLLIGFATRTSEMKKNYRVSLQGEELVDGKKSYKLDLVPQVEAVKQHLTKIELWISEETGFPIQEKLYQSSGDYTQMIYSDMKLEPGLSDERVRLKLPANVKKEYPQK
jgi:outer membrane lipoprotein-sorting protein